MAAFNRYRMRKTHERRYLTQAAAPEYKPYEISLTPEHHLIIQDVMAEINQHRQEFDLPPTAVKPEMVHLLNTDSALRDQLAPWLKAKKGAVYLPLQQQILILDHSLLSFIHSASHEMYHADSYQVLRHKPGNLSLRAGALYEKNTANKDQTQHHFMQLNEAITEKLAWQTFLSLFEKYGLEKVTRRQALKLIETKLPGTQEDWLQLYDEQKIVFASKPTEKEGHTEIQTSHLSVRSLEQLLVLLNTNLGLTDSQKDAWWATRLAYFQGDYKPIAKMIIKGLGKGAFKNLAHHGGHSEQTPLANYVRTLARAGQETDHIQYN